MENICLNDDSFLFWLYEWGFESKTERSGNLYNSTVIAGFVTSLVSISNIVTRKKKQVIVVPVIGYLTIFLIIQQIRFQFRELHSYIDCVVIN
jgi:hypothetical protein